MQSHTNYEVYDTIIGKLTIAAASGSITAVSFGSHNNLDAVHSSSALTDRAAAEIRQYLAGKRQTFDLPLAPAGTAFQLMVWQALQLVPYGKTCSYQQIAQAIGNPKACRAVGMANNKNPIVLIIPCHRVIGKSGKLVGYGGGIVRKEYLLRLESGN